MSVYNTHNRFEVRGCLISPVETGSYKKTRTKQLNYTQSANLKSFADRLTWLTRPLETANSHNYSRHFVSAIIASGCLTHNPMEKKIQSLQKAA